ncbi:hypothetical protein ACWHLZ_28100 [Streptomyces chartreusis]|uniref:hypothetical protein n=1 Tax=Streptomyces chartreusis TaxID=1969 RepID=UPI0034243ACB
MDLDLRGELFIGGVWVDATGQILKRQSLTHTRGRQDQGARVDPSTLRPLLNNTDGRFSPDNPLGPYYGQFGRNTPFRLSLRAGTPFLELPGRELDSASTPDHSSLDITGDIDLRVDATLTNWTEPGGFLDTVELMAKSAGGAGAKSWILGTRAGDLYFEWSADGTNVLTAVSTVPMPLTPSGRMAIRATLDVNNGAGGNTVTFFVAPTMAGPWVQLGAPVVQVGTTSIFNSATSVVIGDATNFVFTPAAGRIHKVEVRNGINGTLAASPDFGAQTIGAASFVDGAGRTWTMNGGASITNRRTRLSHELAAYPTEWHPSGKHAWVDAQTAGILRRLRRGEHALDSTLRRRIPSYGPLAYWPMEEGAAATQAYSPIPGVSPLRLTRASWAQADSLASSNPLPVLASGGGDLPEMLGRVPAPASTLTAWNVQWVYRLDQGNATERTFMRVLSTGTAAEWYIQSGTGGSHLLVKDADGNTITNPAIGTGSDLFGQWVRVRLEVAQVGGNVSWQLVWTDVGGDSGAASSTFAGTIGRPTGMAGPPNGFSSDLDGMAIGHISVWPTQFTAAYQGAIDAWTGETAGERMQRLAEEESLPVTVCGVVADQTEVGPQLPDAVLNLLEQAGEADGGILYEDRERPALRYRDRAGMYNQAPVLTLDYNAPGLAPPLKPTGDDDATENDVTVTRVGGSSGRAVLEEGALSVQAPPNGVGTGYDSSYSLSLHSDAQAAPHAYWRMHLGTYEGRRYPQVHVMVHKAPGLADQILAVDVGDKIVIQNPPKWVAPGDIELIVQGYEETFGGPFQWDIVFNCTPAAPWTVGVVGDGVRGRVDTDRSLLALAASAPATELLVHTPSTDTVERQPWIATAAPDPTVTYPAEFPFYCRLGGEVVRVDEVEPAAWDQFTRTVANGWGTSSSGHAWVESGGSASDRSVGGTVGSITLASAVDTVRFQRATPEAIGDAEVLVRMRVSAVATGASIVPSILLRFVDSSNYYRARLHFGVSGGLFASITRDTTLVGGTPSLPYTYAAGDWFWVKARLTGHRIQMRVWRLNSPEPQVWHHEATISTGTIAAGTIGLTGSAFAGNTNVSPVLGYDDVQVRTPQRWTVVRGQNGITKAQAAVTLVNLAQPSVVAL